jgi:drug/metabolite transporter (DMT)-like permease
MSPSNLRAPLSLVIAATTWGLIWYPYRLLEAAGLSGGVASLITYLIGLMLVLAWWRDRSDGARGKRFALLGVALSAGWTNLAYVLAVIEGEIMRVMLLFYLAPLWTVIFARALLGERPNVWAYTLVAMSILGAWVMLSTGGAPIPANTAEWLGLSAGIGFALSNVLSRRLGHVPARTRAIWIFAGVVLIALPVAVFEDGSRTIVANLSAGDWLLLLCTGTLLVIATMTVQYGLARLPANRAIVILLLELVVAAGASWLLVGEVMDRREWLGGALIVAASLLSGKVETNDA